MLFPKKQKSKKKRMRHPASILHDKNSRTCLDGIRLVGMLLNLEKIVFASSCKETIKEFASYIWDEKALERGEDKPVKQFDHCCDAVRYLCSTIIGRKAARFREIRR